MALGEFRIQRDDRLKRLDLIVESVLPAGLQTLLDLLNDSGLKVGRLRRRSRKGCSEDQRSNRES